MKSLEERILKMVRQAVDDLVDDEIDNAKARIQQRLSSIASHLPVKARLEQDPDGLGFTMRFDMADLEVDKRKGT